MSDLRFNSIAGAVLASVLGIMAVGAGADAIIHSTYPEQPGYLPDIIAETEGGGGPAAPAGPPDFGRLFADPLQLADLVARGERVSGQCKSCHSFEAGAADGIGPNLHDVFGRAPASRAGFAYSDAMRAHSGAWDYLALNDFLRSPTTAVSGTRMTFAGLRADQDRVALIAYLRSMSPNQLALPAPLPEAPAESATADETAPS